MAILVEDGSIVPGANSYLSLEDARAFALARGLTLSADDAVLEPQVIKAVDYIEAREVDMSGERVSSEQELSWPRTPYGIPKNIRSAQGFLVMAVHSGVNLLPTVAAGAGHATKKKVGPIEVAYEVSGSKFIPRVTAAEGMLAPYIGSSLGTVVSQPRRT